MIKLSEIEQTFKDIFEAEEGLVQSVETTYEQSKNKEFFKLVISLHGLQLSDNTIIHTKFIFKTDLGKTHITSDSFIYLYDINCMYHKVEFDSVIDMKKKVQDIVESVDFGTDIQILSDFIEAPASFLNYYMRKNGITDYSVFDVKYEPKFKTTPCDKTTFDFEIDINDNYKFDLSIRKTESDEPDEPNAYQFQFKFMDEVETVETDTLKNIHYFIGSNIARMLDEKLKS